MSTALFLAENKGIEDARSDEVLGIETSTDSLQREEEWMDHGGWEYQSGDDISPLRAGALPLELWWGIFEIITDPRALLACGCTCVAFRDAVRRVIVRRTFSPPGGGKRSLETDPTGGYFFERLEFQSHEFLSWMSTSPIASPRLKSLYISAEWQQQTRHTLSLRFQTRLALSRLKTITRLQLLRVHFSSVSDFARLVCGLPNLATLWLMRITMNDRGSPNLKGAYFTRDLRLQWLYIEDCAFGESHPIWNLLTAPSLSGSLEVISYARDPQRALQHLTLPPAASYSANLVQLTTLRLLGWHLSCGDIRSTVCRSLLSRSSAYCISDVEIYYCCDHSPPHLNDWGSLVLVLDDTVTASKFSSLRTISVSFRAGHPFDVDDVRTLVGSHSHSSSMVFEPETVDETHSVRAKRSEKPAVATEERTERISQSLRIDLGPPFRSYKAAVRYTRCQSP